MPRKERAPRAATAGVRGRRRKQDPEPQVEKLLTDTPSFTSSIADAIVIKEQNVFFLTDPDGQVPLEPGHGWGCTTRTAAS